MIRLSTFTPRMWLILIHDLLATAAAVVASFFIRFEEGGLAERWQLLTVLLPPFILYSGFIYGLSGLYKAKWRFTSLPDLFNIVRAATVLAATLWRSTTCSLHRTSMVRSFSARSRSSSIGCCRSRSCPAPGSPTAIFVTHARFSMPKPESRHRSSWLVAPPMSRYCCARSKAGQ